MKRVVCAVGTTEPWSAAGLSLDARVLAELGTHPLVVVAAVSAQDARGVSALHPVPLEVLRAQLDAVRDAPIDAIRVGALPSLEAARLVAAFIGERAVPVVYDPALGASAGGRLGGDDDEARAIAALLAPHAILTPNSLEAEVFLRRAVRDLEAQRAAARDLVTGGAIAALVTGGHLTGDDAIDVLCDAEGTLDYRAPRLALELRGTGCLLADALCAALAFGEPLRAAIGRARAFVRAKLEAGVELGGMRL